MSPWCNRGECVYIGRHDHVGQFMITGAAYLRTDRLDLTPNSENPDPTPEPPDGRLPVRLGA